MIVGVVNKPIPRDKCPRAIGKRGQHGSQSCLWFPDQQEGVHLLWHPVGPEGCISVSRELVVTVGEIVRPFEICAFLYGAQAVSKLRRGSAAWSPLCCWYSVNRWWHRPDSLAWEAKIFPFPPACFGATIKLLVIENDLLTPFYKNIPSFLLLAL